MKTKYTCLDCPAKIIFPQRGRPPLRCPACLLAKQQERNRIYPALTHARWLAEGCCVTCGQPRDGDSKTLCEKHRKALNEHRAPARKCFDCPAVLERGSHARRCSSCAALRCEVVRELRFAARRASGICASCPQPCAPDRERCQPCLDAMKMRMSQIRLASK